MLVLGAMGTALGYDDFESYTNGQVLATATSNTVSGSRWGRFGAATIDVVTAYTNQGVAGTVGAQYPLNWALGNNGNMEFWFDAPLDLTAAPGLTVSLHIDTAVLSNTTVKAAFEEPDGTIWQSTTGQLLSNTNYVNFLFPFISSAMTRSTGSSAFSLTAIKDLRLRFENAGGSGIQKVFADDFGAVTWTNVITSTNSVLVTNQVFLTSRGMFNRNALWLTGGYASNSGSLSLVPALALQMGTKTDVAYWFVNMGSIGTNGFMVSGTPLGQVPNFLNTVKSWEDQHGKRFVLVAWLNAIITNAVGPGVTNPVTRANIVTECQRFVSTSVPGSHVVGANRTFDGVHFDFEPSGGDTNLANGLLPLMDQTRAGLTSVGLTNGGHISFASQRYATGTSSTARWSPDLYYQMAQKVDSLGVMLYDTTINSASQFQGVVRDQTTNILHAISGTYWNDGLHPAPTNHPLMFMGFAAYLTTSDHNSAVENFTNDAFGADAGITDLINRHDPSVNYFGGAVIYRHTDGTGNDGSASYTNDWQRFQEKWIWGILNSPIPAVLPDISSVLQILSISVATNADVNLSWATLPGLTNVVQSTTGDTSGNFTSNFTDISPPIVVPGSNTVTTNYVEVGAAASASNHYYRVRVSY
jgi:hypothetical protein